MEQAHRPRRRRRHAWASTRSPPSGPARGPQNHWALAKKRGLKTLAKIQANCTWEISAVPYLPVMNLVAQHCSNLADTDIDGLMLSWSVGGYPSPNLQLVTCFDAEPRPTVDQALAKVAEARYGPDAAADVLQAWSKFSTAFAEYPFHGGPALRRADAVRAGQSPVSRSRPSTMPPWSDSPTTISTAWRAIYPAQVLAGQFEKIAAGWDEGLSLFQARQPRQRISQQANLREDAGLAEAAGLHFRSVANQVRFILARNALLSGSRNDAERQAARSPRSRGSPPRRFKTAQRLFTLVCRDSRIGFEASNHYYYLPLDLVEKVVNCEYVRNTWLPGVSAAEKPTGK